jgi:hypothetical protein
MASGDGSATAGTLTGSSSCSGFDATDKLYELAENLPQSAWKVLRRREKHSVKT